MYWNLHTNEREYTRHSYLRTRLHPRPFQIRESTIVSPPAPSFPIASNTVHYSIRPIRPSPRTSPFLYFSTAFRIP